MIFHEVYGCYYNAVARILGEAVVGGLTEKRLWEIVNESGYAESVLSILPAIQNEQWQLVRADLSAPILYKPQMPLTKLEKRWLKTILMDPRIKLFSVTGTGLEDVEPLFLPEDVLYFDRYLDGDDYESFGYVANFHMLLSAIREKRKVEVIYENNKHERRAGIFSPMKLEYSDKEDKFRLLCLCGERPYTINLGRIQSVKRLDEQFSDDLSFQEQNHSKVLLRLVDERNALERVMMKFAHHKKQVVRLGENMYEVELQYDKADETDILIQILSFGPFVEIIEGESLKAELKRRVERQFATFYLDCSPMDRGQ